MLQRRTLRTSTSRPVWAILLSTALVASAALGVKGDIRPTQTEGIAPVAASMETAAFSDGETVVVDDPAVTGQGETVGPRAVKEFTRDKEFSMFALTWPGQQDVVAHFRGQRADGTWTEWFDAEPEPEYGNSGKNGTELVYIEPTKRVQVSLVGVDLVDEQPAEAPVENAELAVDKPAGLPALPTNYGDIKPVAEVTNAGLEAVFIDGGTSTPVAGIDLMADSDGMPRIISRSGWGADESIRTNCQASPDYSDEVNAITIHHTAGSNNYTEAQSAGIVRGIYQYHGANLGWCDVGYHSLVDKYGNIFEGRYGGINKPIMGAHAGGFNENTWAISMMGDYSTVTPSDAQIKSVGELAGWRAKVAGFDPKGSDTHYSEGTSYSKYPYGQAVTLPNIFAHRDVGTTTCPGDAGYAQMGRIRDIAAQKYASIGGSASAPSAPVNTAPIALDNTAPAAQGAQPAAQGAQPANTIGNLLGMLGQAAGGDLNAVLGVAGTLATLVFGFLGKSGKLPAGITVDGGVPKIAGLKISDIPGTINNAQALSSDPDIAKVATLAKGVLGASKGPVQYAADAENPVTFEAFENGAVVKSPATGTHAVHGAIGDAWIQQGLDAGPLGLPTSDEYADGGLTRMDFEHGYITYDPATNQTQIHM
ncbi:N-acetylmuramoyl-L-alanine amidase [Corynebacterium hindlerae]|uniref:N-acetylmuramoyl-L-alanine amidase n=1 Tax=Corynebacterium hindlerae TaxID=699041 RepID=UPI0031B6F5A7